MTALVFRRIELHQLERAEAEGWRAAVERDGAVGVESASAGTIVTVTVVRDEPNTESRRERTDR